MNLQPSFLERKNLMKNSTFTSLAERRSRWLVCGVGLVFAAVLGGCATTSGQGPEGAVSKRSAEYLKARQAGDVDKAYGYLPPSYRAVKDKDRFRLENGAATTLQGGELLSATCEPTRCVVRRNFTALVPMMSNAQVPMSVTETWVNEDGQWWLFLP
jgi:hypothetical protein